MVHIEAVVSGAPLDAAAACRWRQQALVVDGLHCHRRCGAAARAAHCDSSLAISYYQLIQIRGLRFFEQISFQNAFKTDFLRNSKVVSQIVSNYCNRNITHIKPLLLLRDSEVRNGTKFDDIGISLCNFNGLALNFVWRDKERLQNNQKHLV